MRGGRDRVSGTGAVGVVEVGSHHENASEGHQAGGDMLTSLGSRALSWTEGVYPWSNVYGVGRTLLALSTLLTLLLNRSATLFRPLAGAPFEAHLCDATIRRLGIFCMIPGE